MPTLATRLAASITMLTVLTVLTVMTACDNSAARLQGPANAGARSSNVLPVQTTLDAEVRTLVTSGFPKGHATAILAKWDQVVRATGPKTTLNGKSVPGADARSALVRTVTFMKSKGTEAAPPAGETPAHYVARIALDMSLYVYGGPASPVPAVAPSADVAFDIVQPTVTDTIATPAQHAAVIFPANSVSEPTVVVITPDSTYYPDNCSGPLDTHYCQYPRFYHFNVFPDVKLNTPAKVQVCHVDAGAIRAPLADHDRFRFAHDKPADPAEYVPDGQIVDGIEVLPLVSMGVTHCADDGGTTYNTAYVRGSGLRGMLGYVGNRMMHSVSRAAHALFVPENAWAIDQGGGGLTLGFSNFAVVDPQSTPDLAQSTAPGSYFAVTQTQLLPGSTVATTAWSITNLGSGTSGAFTSDIVIATDSLLTSAVSTVPLGGAPSLVPRASYGYTSQAVTVPTTPGTYFIGTRIAVAGADSLASDNLVSMRVTVAPPAAPDVAITNLSAFTVSPASIVQGGVYNASPYTFTNVGGGTTTAFVPRLAFATDTALTTKLQWVQSGPQMTLTAGQSYTGQGGPFTISPCLAPGAYYVGPKADQVSGPDANTADDYFSRRLTVTPASPPNGESVSSASWSTAGPGSLTTQVQPRCATLKYSFPNYNTYDYRTFEYTTTAAATGTYTFRIHYSGLHCWYQAYAGLDVFVNSPSGQQVITVVPWSSVYDFFDFGVRTVTVPLTAGYSWGIRAHGKNYDGTNFLGGTIEIIDP